MMAVGRQRSEWLQTSAQMALLFNCNRDPKKTTAADADHYVPRALRRKRAEQKLMVGLGVLRDVFVRKPS